MSCISRWRACKSNKRWLRRKGGAHYRSGVGRNPSVIMKRHAIKYRCAKLWGAAWSGLSLRALRGYNGRASLPDDACISREEQEQKLDAIAGPDGSPLIPRGHVSLVFSISGVPFRHRFLVIEGNPMLLLGNDFLASHAAVISLSSKDSEGTIRLSRSTEGKDVVLQVSTGPRVSGAYSISSIQTVGEAETIPRLQYAKPLTIDFGRDPREPFSTPVEGQEAEITPLFSTADELAARAPATCSSEFLLYADTAVRIPGLSKASFLVPAPLALREHKDCAMFVDRLPHRDGLDDTPLVLPHVERTTEDFKIRVTSAVGL
eukprot:scaffold18765_cov131-Isochrysis_galbana.AAC.1